VLTFILFGVDGRATGGMLSASAERREFLKQRAAALANAHGHINDDIDDESSTMSSSSRGMDRNVSGEAAIPKTLPKTTEKDIDYC
jgi:hypothetical protein